MLEQSTLMCNITLFENELKMAKLRLMEDMVADVLTKALSKK
jgi:hypothetical protein